MAAQAGLASGELKDYGGRRVRGGPQAHPELNDRSLLNHNTILFGGGGNPFLLH